MKEKVYLLKISDNMSDEIICAQLEKVILESEFFSFIEPQDFVAIKTHFGEENSDGYVRPIYLKMMGDVVRKAKGRPFLTETSTLYGGKRKNAVDHISLANQHGFGYENTGLPIVMADGLLGNEEIKVNIPGRKYQQVGIASLIVRSQSLIVVSHFTGHILSGFGAALKNLGMGCASRRGKLIQHSTARPVVKKGKCTACGECVPWCPTGAISLDNTVADIDKNKCIGCGECLTVCRFEAIGYNWSETYKNLQQKIVEHALGAVAGKSGKVICLNFLNRITKDCDCMRKYEKIVPDIGILISFDPVAIDAASLALVEQKIGQNFSRLTYDIPYKFQLDYASQIGFGSLDFELIELN